MPEEFSGTFGASRVKDGSITTDSLAPGAVTPAKSSGFPFTKEYISPEQTITAGGSLTLIHGLGARPKLVHCTLVCKVAEAGYLVGAEVSQSHYQPTQAAAGSYGVALVLGGLQITAVYGASAGVFLIPNRADGTTHLITPGNWALVVRAWV